MLNITLEFGTNEDKSWVFYINGFDLTNSLLRSQIRIEETQELVGAFAVTMLTAGSLKLTMTKAVSATIPAGEYISDVLATSTIDGTATFITPIFKVIVTQRVTEPV